MCVQCVSAYPVHVSVSMNYSSTYKGSGHVGHVHTASCSHTHAHSHAHAVYAQAPITTMRSTSSRMGTIATTSSAQVHTIGTSGGGYAGIASAGSNSSSRGINYGGASASIVYTGGFTTSASAIRGGVVAEDLQTSRSSVSPRRGSSPSGNPQDCECTWIDNGDGTYTCSKCGTTISEDDYLDGNFHTGDCPCHVPLECGWEVMLFLACLGGYYAYSSKRRKKETATPLV